MTLSTYLPWRPVTHGARTPLVSCWRCRASELNDTNRLRQMAWQECRWGRGWVFRCGDCARAEP
jgi:hypothetical protein